MSEYNIPPPPAPKKGYVQRYDIETKTWLFEKRNMPDYEERVACMERIKEMCDTIENHRFAHDCWEEDIEWLQNGHGYDDSYISDYIMKLEDFTDYIRNDDMFNERVKYALVDIDDCRFQYGDWRDDLEALTRKKSYNQYTIVDYIRCMEFLVELIRTSKPVNKKI